MSLIKKLDDISETKERSKSLSEAIDKVAEEMKKLRGGKSSKTTRSKGEAEEA